MHPVNRWPHTDSEGERGSASLEFIASGLILLVPLVYLILAMAVLQGGALAVEGAARQAVSVYVHASDENEGMVRVNRAVDVALADYGIDSGNAVVHVTCDSSPRCLTRQKQVTVSVRLVVPLPLVPDFLSVRRTAGIPIEASASEQVSRFWGTVP